MALTVSELKRWLFTLRDEDEICIDDGGLAIQLVDDADVYIEIGGEPDFDER